MTLLGRWRAADDPRRVELYTRWSLLPMVFLAPLVVAGFVVSTPAAQVAGVDAVVLASLVQAVVSALLVDRVVDRRPVGAVLRAAWVLSALAVVVVAVTTLGAQDAAVATGSAVVLAVAPLGRFRFRRYASAAVAVAAGTAALTWVVDPLPTPADAARSAALHLLYAVAAAAVLQLSLWLLDVVRRLGAAERDRVRLAVAEERLRFARDLHDVVGRDLSAIAVTSDLVAELARRGRPEAVQRAEEVRGIAQQSLQQIRDVVRGYRSVDLRQELDGSVALLRSAGVVCTVEDGLAAPDRAPEPGLPADVQSAAAWVIREGVTNVVRHSSATWCRISLQHRAADRTLEVRLVNDGSPDGDRAAGRGGSEAPGSGLPGLAERLRPYGGALDVTRRDGTFELTARLEVPA